MSQEVRIRNDLVVALSSQAEIYRIRSEQAVGSLAIIRPATVNPIPAGPSKKKTVLAIAALAGLLTLGLVFALEQLRVTRRHPITRSRLESLRATRLGSALTRAGAGMQRRSKDSDQAA